MKKNGFTLAEVLITLTIIGVVATMTLPALITNTQEQQAITGLKKGITTLTDIAQMNSAIENFDYSSIASNTFGDPDINNGSLYAMLATRCSIDMEKSASPLPNNVAPAPYTGPAVDGVTPDSIIYLRDGSAILYNAAVTVANVANAARSRRAADGAVQGYPVIYDTNGAKAPNILSNCQGTVAGAADPDTRFAPVTDVASQAAQVDITTACTQNNGQNRVIRDQFQVQLRAGYAVPRGAAAQWAFNK